MSDDSVYEDFFRLTTEIFEYLEKEVKPLMPNVDTVLPLLLGLEQIANPDKEVFVNVRYIEKCNIDNPSVYEEKKSILEAAGAEHVYSHILDSEGYPSYIVPISMKPDFEILKRLSADTDIECISYREQSIIPE